MERVFECSFWNVNEDIVALNVDSVFWQKLNVVNRLHCLNLNESYFMSIIHSGGVSVIERFSLHASLIDIKTDDKRNVCVFLFEQSIYQLFSNFLE